MQNWKGVHETDSRCIAHPVWHMLPEGCVVCDASEVHTAARMYVCMDGWMDGWMDGCACFSPYSSELSPAQACAHFYLLFWRLSSKQVISTVSGGGKVLIPVFAVGRAQELLLLVEDAWRRSGLAGRVPLYCSGAMAGRANVLYRAHAGWAAQAVRAGAARRTAFTFQSILSWDPQLMMQQVGEGSCCITMCTCCPRCTSLASCQYNIVCGSSLRDRIAHSRRMNFIHA
jgi:hypothetical protein